MPATPISARSASLASAPMSAPLLIFTYAVPWYLPALVAALAGAMVALPLGGAMLRLKGPFFAIGMFGLARVLEAFALGFDSITGGGTGIYLTPVSDLRPVYYV